jgi:cell division protein FtsL
MNTKERTMKNPIQKNGFFATPDSMQALEDQIMSFTGQERMVAMTAALMALNLASKLVDEELKTSYNTLTNTQGA